LATRDNPCQPHSSLMALFFMVRLGRFGHDVLAQKKRLGRAGPVALPLHPHSFLLGSHSLTGWTPLGGRHRTAKGVSSISSCPWPAYSTRTSLACPSYSARCRRRFPCLSFSSSRPTLLACTSVRLFCLCLCSCFCCDLDLFLLFCSDSGGVFCLVRPAGTGVAGSS